MDVWDEVWQGAETLYSDKPTTQNQVFEHVKILKLREIFPKDKFTMLEVGCGTAFVSEYFAKHGSLVTCLDTNKKILEIAKENFEKENARGKFVLGDAEKLPLKDNQFDVVSSFGLLEHFKDPKIAIDEMVRVLKPGGVFFADIVPNRYSIQTLGNIFNLFASFINGILQRNPILGFRKGMRNIRPLYYESSMSWKEYEMIIKEAGVNDLKVRGNRPFPRLTLPNSLDKVYASIIKFFIPFWRVFDERGGVFARTWGAGLWFWGIK